MKSGFFHVYTLVLTQVFFFAINFIELRGFLCAKKTVEIIKKCKQTIGLVSFALSVDIQKIHAKLTISIRIGIVCVS